MIDIKSMDLAEMTAFFKELWERICYICRISRSKW